MEKSNKKYKVLHIFSSYGGGISSLVINLLENKTSDFSFDIMAFSFDNGEQFLKRVESSGARYFLMPRPRKDGKKAFESFVKNVISTNKYDAIHCHIATIKAYPFYKISKSLGIKNFILHAHTTKYDTIIDKNPLMRAFSKWLNYKMATCYMGCSDLAANYVFGSKYISKKDYYMIPNGIKCALFENELTEEQRKKYNEEFSIDDNTLVTLNVGRCCIQKNQEFILKIVKGLKEKGVRIVCLIVGVGPMLNQLKSQALELGIGENVRFLERRSDINELMRYSNLFLLPSGWEGLPTVAVEAQAAGVYSLISNTITAQCDLGLNLVKFLPINSVEGWINEIENRVGNLKRERDIDRISIIEDKGFTAERSGHIYCDVLKKIIEKRDLV